MHITRLQCMDFRNYAAVDLTLPAGRIAIIGENGQGKTNLAEMVQVLACGKSHRTSSDRRLIRLEQPLMRVAAGFIRRDLGPCSVVTAYARSGERKWWLNGAPRSRPAEVLGYLNCCLFSATDIDLIAGEPAGRRRHLNEELAKAFPAYYDDLLAYRRALAQRNKLLREAKRSRSLACQIRAFSAPLAQFGGKILVRRRDHLAELAPRVTGVYERIAGGAERLCMAYRPGVAVGPRAEASEAAEALLAALEEAFESEIERGATMVGPHRDDFVLKLGGTDLRRYGSRGQQKTAAVALRLAGAALATDRDEAPVLILDDILTELDPGRRDRLMGEIEPYDQAIITGTTEADFAPEFIAQATRLIVEAGVVRHGE